MQFHTLEEKTIHVTRWRASGLTGQQYTEQNDIRYGSFKNWSLQIKKAQAASDAVQIVTVQIQTEEVVDKKAASQASPSDAIGTLSQSPKLMSSNHAHTAKHPKQPKAISDPSTVASPVSAPCVHSQPLSLDFPELSLPPEISDLSVLLPSGLVIKCSLLLLPQVIKMMEPLYDA